MITKNDLKILSNTKYENFPIIGIPNIVERLNEIYNLYKKNIIIDEINEDNVYNAYFDKNWQNGSISEIKHIQAYQKFFTEEEILQILIPNPYSGNTNIKESMKENKFFNFIYKIKFSLFHNGSAKINWNDIVNFSNKCLTFEPFSEYKNIDVTFDVTSYLPNAFGKTKYSDNFIDGEMAFILSYKGKDSFIVSIDILKNKQIHIKQIQSLIPKRNKMRFLLGDDYFEKIIIEFTKHFDDYKFELITAQGLVQQISYEGKDLKEKDSNAFERINYIYNQEFKTLKRNKINKQYKSVNLMNISSIEFQEISL